MVNTGHPSRACKLCRARRVRCDETKPACLKCQKSKRACPGYRDPFEINLRDETAATIRKAKAAHQGRVSSEKKTPGRSEADLSSLPINSSPSRDSSASPDSSWLSPATSRDSYAVSVIDMSAQTSPLSDLRTAQNGMILSFDTRHSSLPFSLQTSVEDQAACFFLSNYVLSPTKGPDRGVWTFLVPLLNQPDVKHSPLPMAFAATSMAALAGRPSSRQLLPSAHGYYSRALKEIKLALQDKRRSLLDSSIAAVVLLSFYEVIITQRDISPTVSTTDSSQGLASDDDPLRAWSHHLNGAKALIRLRHQNQVPQTRESIEMFCFVRSLMVRKCLLFRAPLAMG